MTGKKQNLIVVGGGGFGREVLWLASDCPEWEPLGFLDDAKELQGRTISGAPLLGTVADWIRFPDAHFVIGVGSPRARLAIYTAMKKYGAPSFATLIHPSVCKSRFVTFGEGCMATAGCILTTQIAIGRHCILDRSVTVGHDCTMGDFCTVAPLVPISGNVHLADGAEIGTGASIRQGIKIGRGAMVGMGAVVTKDVGEAEIVVGSPAARLRTIEPF